MPDSPQAVRHCSIKNNLSAVYAQSNAARILNRPALPLPRSGAAGQVPACRQRAGRSAGPEVGRDVPTPPSLPLDSTHPATGKGLLAPFRPQRGSRTGKNLAASLNDFFSVLHLYPLSRCGGSSPKGSGGGEIGHFALEPETLPLPLKPSPLGGKVLNEVKRMRGDSRTAAASLRPHPSAPFGRSHLPPTGGRLLLFRTLCI